MNPRVAVPLFTTLAFAAAAAATGVLVAPAEVWPHVLLTGWFIAGIGLGGGFVVAVHDTSSGRWLGPVRRIACSLTRLVLPGSLLILIAVIAGGTQLFPAWHGHVESGSFKAFWLNRPFFTARAFVYVAAWLGALQLLRRRRAAAYLVIFGVTLWLASFDWLMSVDPRWSSTIFGVYHFAGVVSAALAVIAIVTVSRARLDPEITTGHVHDVAKLLFAFTTFWMYIWFSQAMLIWYGNIPEEAAYYAVRAYGNWGVLFWITVLLSWVLPFVLLLPERAKTNANLLTRVSIGILIGHWLDLYVTIVPAAKADPQLTGWELALALGAFAAVGWAVTRPEEPAVVPASSRA